MASSLRGGTSAGVAAAAALVAGLSLVIGPTSAAEAGERAPAAREDAPAYVVAQSSRRRSRRRGRSAEERPEPRRAARAEASEQLDPVDAARYEAARNVCRAMLAGKPIVFTPAEPHERPPCVIAAPVRISSIGSDAITLKPAVLIDCRVAVALVEWIDRVVQPAARETFGVPVRALASASGYVCRPRNNEAGAKLSEHAFGKAIDIAGFELAGGRRISVLTDWPTPQAEAEAKTAPAAPKEASAKPAAGKVAAGKVAAAKASTGKTQAASGKPAQRTDGRPAVTAEAAKAPAFLKAVHKGACGLFSTVLGPEADAQHRDHFHLDLSGRSSGAICE